MAEAVEDEIENALNLVVSTAEQSSNMRKALKEKIFETLSTLGQLFVKIKISGDRKLSEINNLIKVSKLERELQSCREK
jgi:DNA-binding protein YbaB